MAWASWGLLLFGSETQHDSSLPPFLASMLRLKGFIQCMLVFYPYFAVIRNRRNYLW